MNKKFSKSFLLFLCLTLAFFVVGCKKNNDNKNNSFDTTNVTMLSAYNKATNLGFQGSLEEFIELVSGADGKDGIDGEDGVGIDTVLINNNGHLIVTLSNGETINVGKIIGSDGTNGIDGIGIKAISFNANGELIITRTLTPIEQQLSATTVLQDE